MTESQLPSSSSFVDDFQLRINTIFGGSTRVRSFMDSGPRSMQNNKKSKNGVINIQLIEPDYDIESQKLLLADTPEYYNSCTELDMQRIRDAQFKATSMIKKLIDDVSAPYLAEIAFIQKSMEAKLKSAYEFSDKLQQNLHWTNNRMNAIANSDAVIIKIKEEKKEEDYQESYFDSIIDSPKKPRLKIGKPVVINGNLSRKMKDKETKKRKRETPEVLAIMKQEYGRYKWPTPSRTPFNEGFLRHIWNISPHLQQYYTKVSTDNEIQFKAFLKHWRNRTLRYKAMEYLGPLYLATKPPAGSKKKIPQTEEI